MVDVHCHLAALPTRDNGCLLSRRMLRSPVTRMVAWAHGLPLDDPEAANRKYLADLRARLAESRRVSGAVLLAMDGVYDGSGRLDEGRTDFLISNDAVLASAREDPRLLAGVSINPSRRDALAELERCAAAGAALVKVLPNAQAFDPAERAYRRFYRRLGELGIPLLSHVGYEFSLIGQDQGVGDPARLRDALEEGATVIAAHGCSNGLFLVEPHLRTMLDLAARYERFFVDLSALSLPNRFGALLRLRRLPQLAGRLLFGTDYPLPCFAFPALAGSLGGYLAARALANPFDRHAAVLDALGVAGLADFSAARRKSS